MKNFINLKCNNNNNYECIRYLLPKKYILFTFFVIYKNWKFIKITVNNKKL